MGNDHSLQKDAKGFAAFSLLLFLTLLAFFRNDGFFAVLIISLKLSLFIHLPGYLLAVSALRGEYDAVALLFIGFGFGIALVSFSSYALGTLMGADISDYTYAMPLVLAALLALQLGRMERQ